MLSIEMFGILLHYYKSLEMTRVVRSGAQECRRTHQKFWELSYWRVRPWTETASSLQHPEALCSMSSPLFLSLLPVTLHCPVLQMRPLKGQRKNTLEM